MAEEKREGTGRDPIDELVDEITGNVNWDDPKWRIPCRIGRRTPTPGRKKNRRRSRQKQKKPFPLLRAAMELRRKKFSPRRPFRSETAEKKTQKPAG